MSEEKTDFRKRLRRVTDAIQAARCHFSIWRIYEHKDYKPKYLDTMNCYLGFFRASISAQFTSMLLCLTKVIDSNKSNNRQSIYTILEDADFIDSTLRSAINQKLYDIKPLCKKLFILRHNHFAHLGQWDALKAFKKAKLSFNVVEEIIETLEDVLHSIWRAYDRSDGFASDSGSTERSTHELFQDLMRLSSIIDANSGFLPSQE